MASIDRIEDLIEDRLSVSATAVRTKTGTVVTFSYNPAADDVREKWSALVELLSKSDAVKIRVKAPKREGELPHYRLEFIERKPAVVYEFLKRSVPMDKCVVDKATGHWGFQPKNVTTTRGDLGEDKYGESESI